jgi:plasmid stabilization system protein ParE
MELKWTSKALSDLTRLYDFLAPVNQPASARTVQALAAAPAGLLVQLIVSFPGAGQRRPADAAAWVAFAGRS